MADRLKNGDPASMYHIHQQCLYSIVTMMSQGDLIALILRCRIRQGSFAQGGTSRTAEIAVVFRIMEECFIQVRINADQFGPMFFEIRGKGRNILSLKAHIQMDPDDTEIAMIVMLFDASVLFKRVQQQDRILAAGNTDTDAVSVTDHLIVSICFSE